MNKLTESLIKNSKSAIIGSVELHNKPIFSYRYEVCTILTINGWELILKAYLLEKCPRVNIFLKDDKTMPFEKCIIQVYNHLGKPFRTIQENLKNLYKFRNNMIHYYEDSIDAPLYSLLHKSIMLFNIFLKEHFNEELAEETNLMLLPIGFKPFASPVDFLSKNSELSECSDAVKEFLEGLIVSTILLSSEGVEDTIFTGFSMALINERKTENADIVVGITKNNEEAKLTVSKILSNKKLTNDDSANKFKIDEESLFKNTYTLEYREIATMCRGRYLDFKQNPKFNEIMSCVKKDPNYCRKRLTNVNKIDGSGQHFYCNGVFDKLDQHYTLKNE